MACSGTALGFRYNQEQNKAKLIFKNTSIWLRRFKMSESVDMSVISGSSSNTVFASVGPNQNI